MGRYSYAMPYERSLTIKAEGLSDALLRDVNRLNAVIEEAIQRFKGPFAVGARFTGLDAFLAPMVVRAVGYQLPLSPLSREYLHHSLRNPWLAGWIRAARAEPWREPHEDEEGLDEVLS